ncbi:glycosyltransferase family 4 protein [Williamsia maris]|uniref:Glycosyltransferase involved in cell wall bisynthesis n=1 Tax=Williamsia maris TaxID=72806 RepID=A0ABT1HE32_9NOCA|nr:glycosyltransferase family 1 protein [Williamsia maris]MCP2176517.1 Glycosyltransferase involved in cell wall bisynthesis [Williamsia maris]
MTHEFDVVFGALALRPGGSGVQTYARELLAAAAAADTDRSMAAIVQSDSLGELPDSVTGLGKPVTSGVRRAISGLAPSPASGRVFHSLDVDLPIRVAGLTVSTVHDLSVFDTPWASSALRARGERALLRRAFRRADILIAVSEFTAARVLALSGRRSHVIPLAPASWALPPTAAEVAEVRDRLGLPERFVLQVGTVEPRKDVALLADACVAVDIPLVLAGAGSTGPDAPRRAHGLGYVATSDLPALYAAATVTAYCSRYEGFGLPPVEAMACTGAVVASAVGALPDVVADGALLVRHHTVEAWSEALRGAMDPETNSGLRTRGPQAAAALSWKAAADTTLALYGGTR